MELERLSVPAINRFASLYLKQEAPVTEFFHYNLSEKGVYEKRVSDLQKRKFKREQLADCIEEYMKSFSATKAVADSLHKLRDERSVVVIGGQQAGLLTGPMYTIHKIVSIIKLAKDQEERLGIPVIPVFWIAGEDHDFLEVNHVYVHTKDRMEKKGYPELLMEKRMVSDIQYDKTQMKHWTANVFSSFGETGYTNQLLAIVNEAIENQQTITGLFTSLVHTLFSEFGLLMIDAAYPALRKLEVPFFEKLIQQSEQITEAVHSSQEKMSNYEFNRMIEISPSAGNLFIYENNERQLLEYDSEKELFAAKNSEITYTKEELLELVRHTPEKLSNNVVSRPMMQEWLFPTLSFIAGPGEIAYWGELKEAFELMGMNMPPIVARLNMTIVERHVLRDLQQLDIPLNHSVLYGVNQEKMAFWNSVRDESFHELISAVQSNLMNQYKEIETKAAGLSKGLVPVVEKNKEFHVKQLEYLSRKTDEMIKLQNETMLNRYDQIERSLKPNGGPQERVWNVFYYLNQYGIDFLPRLMELDFQFTGEHQLIKV